MPPEGSTTRLIAKLKQGQEAAAGQLWERRFEQVRKLVRRHLRHGPCLSEEEDVALSVFTALCCGARKGKFPKLHNSKGLDRLLGKLARNKAVDARRRFARRVKTEPIRQTESEESSLPHRPHGPPTDPRPAPDRFVSSVELCEQLLQLLRDEQARRIAVLRLEGHSIEEIAADTGCSRSTVNRKLEIIRRLWTPMLEDPDRP